jgi:hypothetical protein
VASALDDLPADPDDPATQAYRARIRARFAELHEERELLETQLKALVKTIPAAADTALLDRLPLAGDVLPRLPPRLKAKLFAAFDLSILWNKPASQVTVRAEISDATLQAVTEILDASQQGFDDTHPGQPDPIRDLAHTPRAVRVWHSSVQAAQPVWREGLERSGCRDSGWQACRGADDGDRRISPREYA